jgi:hypothetical protein
MDVGIAIVAKSETDAVKLAKDLVRKARVISLATGKNMSDYLSAICRPTVDRDYPKALRKLQEEGDDTPADDN